MRAAVLLALLVLAGAFSDIARQYPPGSEPAKGGKDLSVQYPPGKELAHVGNQHLAHTYGDISR